MDILTINTIQRKNLILFTESFPFGKGEQFLETEIAYLERRFREIILVPSVIDGPKRCTPESMRIELSLSQQILNDYKMPKISRITQSGMAAINSVIFYKEAFSKPRSFTDPRIFIKIISYLAYAKRAQKWLLSYIDRSNVTLENTLFYTYWLGPITMGLILAKSKFPAIKVISRVHAWDLYEERHTPPYLPFRQIIYDNIDQVFAISDHGKNYLTKYQNKDPNRFIVSRLGTNDPGFNTAYSKDGIFRIVSCSFLVPEKRINLLISGIRVLAERRPKLSILWSHLGDGSLRSQLEKEAKHNLPDSVIYNFHGMLSNKTVFEFYRENSIDVFINVSKTEGIPVSIMEAQSCGIPVIATAVGGSPEIVNNKNGILLESNPTPLNIADALEEFVSSRNEILDKRILSKSNWFLNYNANLNYNKYCDILFKL